MTRNVGGWLCALLIPWAAAAEPPSRESLPEALRGWADWVLHDERERACPELLDQGRRACGWPGFLQLTLTGQGGRFRQSYRAFRDGYFRLPGNGEHWPQEVRVDGKPAVVVTAGDAPAVRLCAGEHAVEGQFLWDVLPESLAVPEDVGLVSLSVNGKSVARPNREGGQLFFRREAEAGSEAEAVEVRVHRRVTDEIPLLLTTQVELRVSGKNRELLLGRALPEGFTPMRLESGIPARIESDGRIRLQARPGSFSLVLTARGHSPLSSLTRPEPDGLWSEEEVWVFEARPSLRQVAIEGVNAVDPQQTTLPAEWRGFPAYAVGLKDEMKLVERQRGDQSAPPDRVALQRELWLDFGGAGYSVQDRLTGRIYRSTRLEAGSGLEVGRVASAGAEQLLTRLKADGPVGVELQQGAVNLLADGRVSGRTGVSAVGWNLDVQSLSAKLHLPPGWRLFHATGVDRSGLTWIGSWSLFDLFLVLVTAAATARLYGKRMGVLALAALTLAYPEEDAPKVIWLLALAAEALVRAVTHAGAQRVLRILRVATLGILALWGVAFAVQHVREAMYPQLRRSYQALGQLESYAQYQTRNRQELQSSLEASPAEPEPQNEVLDESVGAEQEVMEKGSAPSFGGRRMKPPMPAPAAPPANP
ncbi:MAG TPA: hypothetical protein VEY30_10915, partial [Myxococcaceae bacterium]|nr:hypothetical protein [Myxococcaceae bacterium]